ncbi:hypothetical protein TWF281_003761 [Arthrobotrys megalospora]
MHTHKPVIRFSFDNRLTSPEARLKSKPTSSIQANADSTTGPIIQQEVASRDEELSRQSPPSYIYGSDSANAISQQDALSRFEQNSFRLIQDAISHAEDGVSLQPLLAKYGHFIGCCAYFNFVRNNGYTIRHVRYTTRPIAIFTSELLKTVGSASLCPRGAQLGVVAEHDPHMDSTT